MKKAIQQKYSHFIFSASVLFTAFVMLVGIYFYTSRVQQVITDQERVVSSLYVSWIALKEELYHNFYDPSSYDDLIRKFSEFESVLQKTFLSGKLDSAKIKIEEIDTISHAMYIKWPYINREIQNFISELSNEEQESFPQLFTPTVLMENFEQDLLQLDKKIRAFSLEQLNNFQLYNNLILTSLVLLLLGFLMFLISSRQKHLAEERIRLLTQSLLKVQEEERKQIAYDLHDDIVQDLASLKMNMDNIVTSYSEHKDIHLGMFKEISNKMKDIIQATRQITGEIKPYNIDHIGLVGAIRSLCNNLALQTGSQVRFFPVGINSLHTDYTTDINLYRITQEALQNIRKHSEATRISVRLIASSPHIILKIHDNGKGFNPSLRFTQITPKEFHLGLTSMEERAHLLNGEFTITSSTGRGTEIKVKVPIRYETSL